METPLPTYTYKQISQHSSEHSAWIAIDGYVYDVTPFLQDHPGGKDIVMDHLGKDASSVFVDERVHEHSQAAYTMLLRYRVGMVEEANPIDRATQDKDLAQMVDVTKPILPQIPKLGAKYQPWLHSQCGLQKIIIFDSFLEMFTRWPWTYIFVLWTPYLSYFMYKSFQEISPLQNAIMFALGLFSWTIVEYVLHRFVFHVQSDTTMWNYFHFFAHGIHHLTPNDSTRLTFPPTFSGVIALVLWQVPGLFPAHLGVRACLAGLGTGFVLYDTCHYYFHHGEAKWMPMFLQQMKTAHLNHHYKDDTVNFGVSSPLFDWVCGTLARPPGARAGAEKARAKQG